MLDKKFVIIGALLNISGSINYVYNTVLGRTKPNRVSWTLWAIAPLVAFAAEIHQGVGLESLMTFMVGFGPLLVVSASLLNKQAYWKISRFDVVCGGLSLLALALWAITRSGDVAIALSIAADLLAAVPTLVKAYREPASESHTVFAVGAISAAITLLTVKVWSFASYGFPLYILLICIVFTTLIAFPHLRPNRKLRAN